MSADGKDTLGAKIRQARKRKGLTLKKLGESVGVSHAALSQIENNKANPSKATLISLARKLNDDFGDKSLRPHLQPESPDGAPANPNLDPIDEEVLGFLSGYQNLDEEDKNEMKPTIIMLFNEVKRRLELKKKEQQQQ